MISIHQKNSTNTWQEGRVQLKYDGTQWRTGGEVKGKLANAVGSQYPSHYLGTWCIQHYYRWCAHLGCASSRLNWRPPNDLNGLVRFAERRNLVSARVPSHFSWPLLTVPLQDSRLRLKCDGTRWGREGKWRGNWRMEWVASTLHTTSEHGVSSITTADAHTSAVPVVDWTDVSRTI